ncbi:hypothetical protein CPCC7001_509 [Cyanobium sp. PCC 7001]|nr:hypothetical protein CPCC7001_509 [Cyanobium sp. PCC 7001]
MAEPVAAEPPAASGSEQELSAQARVLLDQVAWCLATTCAEDPGPWLAAAEEIVRGQPASESQVDDWLTIARLRAQLGEAEAAKAALQEARKTVEAITPATSRRVWQSRLALGYAALGDVDTSRALQQDALAQGDASEQTVAYPFPEGPGRLKAGLGVTGTSFDETTMLGSLSFSLFKPWSRQDLSADGLFVIDYDSGRDNNRIKPNIASSLMYRYHLNDDWHLFVSNFTNVNSGVFASGSDDEDTSALVASYVGPGINLWRGRSTEHFLDLQFGILGARYEYEDLNFKLERNELTPSVVLILFGRGIPIGRATLSPTLAVGAGSDQLDQLVMYSDVNLNVPISKRWAWSSRVVWRYTTRPVRDNPNLNLQYVTGLTYTFKP